MSKADPTGVRLGGGDFGRAGSSSSSSASEETDDGFTSRPFASRACTDHQPTQHRTDAESRSPSAGTNATDNRPRQRENLPAATRITEPSPKNPFLRPTFNDQGRSSHRMVDRQPYQDVTHEGTGPYARKTTKRPKQAENTGRARDPAPMNSPLLLPTFKDQVGSHYKPTAERPNQAENLPAATRHRRDPAPIQSPLLPTFKDQVGSRHMPTAERPKQEENQPKTTRRTREPAPVSPLFKHQDRNQPPATSRPFQQEDLPSTHEASPIDSSLLPDFKDQVRNRHPPNTSKKTVPSVEGVPMPASTAEPVTMPAQVLQMVDQQGRPQPTINAKNTVGAWAGYNRAKNGREQGQSEDQASPATRNNEIRVCAEVVDQEAERRREEEYRQMMSTVRQLREQIAGVGGDNQVEAVSSAASDTPRQDEGKCSRLRKMPTWLKILAVISLILVAFIILLVVYLVLLRKSDRIITQPPTNNLPQTLSPASGTPAGNESPSPTVLTPPPTQASVSISLSPTTPPTGIPNETPPPTTAYVLPCLTAPDECTWEQVGGSLNQNAQDRTSYWGTSVALAGEILAIGVPGDGTFDAVPGYVTVYEYSSSNDSWVHLDGNNVIGEASNDRFGSSVALSSDGRTLAVGAFGNDGDDGSASSAGHVQVFRFSAISGWSQIGNDIDGEESGDETGRTLALSADGLVVAVGTRNAYPRVFVYSEDTGWSSVGDLTIFEYDSSKVSLSSNGNVLAVGNSRDSTGGFGAGSVRVFRYSTTIDWLQVGNTILGEKSEDKAGHAVALSSNGLILAIGSPAPDEVVPSPGSVRVFEYVDRDWVQQGQTIQGKSNGDNFGWDVSISDTGLILACSARFDNQGGQTSGKVSLYLFDGNDWVQIGDDVVGESSFDLFGSSLSLTKDGSAFAAGAVIGDYVKVYKANATLPVM